MNVSEAGFTPIFRRLMYEVIIFIFEIIDNSNPLKTLNLYSTLSLTSLIFKHWFITVFDAQF
jgi:hypothetical protein